VTVINEYAFVSFINNSCRTANNQMDIFCQGCAIARGRKHTGRHTFISEEVTHTI
ncbi:unnamed protein product, partial [Candidula unifasciata]